MILSHRHRFIFIKTTKTAGTSLEIALSRHCGPEDVITPVYPDSDERLRRDHGGRGPQNWRGPFLPVTRGDLAEPLYQRRPPRRFWNHMPAATVRARTDARTWATYTKFAVSRHPLEVMASHWRMERARRQTQQAFGPWLARNIGRARVNFSLMQLKGLIAMDCVIRYSHLREDLDRLSQRLGLPGPLGRDLEGIVAKPGNASAETSALACYENHPEAIDLVREAAADEIAAMGYDCSLAALGEACRQGAEQA